MSPIFLASLRYFQMVFVVLIIFNSKSALSQEGVELNLKPKQCISLREGQKCYTLVEISWHAQSLGEYCLFSSVQKEALQCWKNDSSGNYKSELTIKKDLVFTIKNRANSIEASATIELGWVYKRSSRKKSSWRMF